LPKATPSIEATTNAINDALSNQHLLIDRSTEAGLVDALLAKREAPVAPPPAPQALPEWLSEAQAAMCAAALRDPAGILSIVQPLHPGADITSRCLTLADHMERHWRFEIPLSALDRCILRATLDALLFVHSQEATFDGRRLGVARRLEQRLVEAGQVPAHE
jgi:hypothetical protein